jgi:hypothetical protein
MEQELTVSSNLKTIEFPGKEREQRKISGIKERGERRSTRGEYVKEKK